MKAGDTIKIREDLIIDKMYGTLHALSDMCILGGKVCTIKKMTKAQNVILDLDCGFVWAQEMLELIRPKFIVGAPLRYNLGVHNESKMS